MKISHSNNWIRTAVLYIALALALSFLTIPLLAKGISHITGDPMGQEKLYIRPIPAPLPPLLLADNEQPEATPAPVMAAPIPEAVPVPALSTSAQEQIAQPSRSESSSAWRIPSVAQGAAMGMTLIFVILLVWAWFQRVSDPHSLPRECA